MYTALSIIRSNNRKEHSACSWLHKIREAVTGGGDPNAPPTLPSFGFRGGSAPVVGHRAARRSAVRRSAIEGVNLRSAVSGQTDKGVRTAVTVQEAQWPSLQHPVRPRSCCMKQCGCSSVQENAGCPGRKGRASGRGGIAFHTLGVAGNVEAPQGRNALLCHQPASAREAGGRTGVAAAPGAADQHAAGGVGGREEARHCVDGTEAPAGDGLPYTPFEMPFL